MSDSFLTYGAEFIHVIDMRMTIWRIQTKCHRLLKMEKHAPSSCVKVGKYTENKDCSFLLRIFTAWDCFSTQTSYRDSSNILLMLYITNVLSLWFVVLDTLHQSEHSPSYSNFLCMYVISSVPSIYSFSYHPSHISRIKPWWTKEGVPEQEPCIGRTNKCPLELLVPKDDSHVK